MIDIAKWEIEISKEIHEANLSFMDAIKKGDKPSLLDLAPGLKEILKDSSYGWWCPPYEIDDLKNPARRLVTTLTTAFSPEVILLPLYCHMRSKEEFAESYGLNEECGIVYEDFLNLVKMGRIRVFIPSKPSLYTSSFYQDIFQNCRDCELGSYQPPQYPLMFSGVTVSYNLMQELGADLNKETFAQGLKRDVFHIDYWRNRSENSFKLNIPALSPEELELHTKGMGTDACELYQSGFGDLVNFLFGKLINQPRLLEIVLRYYSYYLIKGYSDGLGGLRFYAPNDVARMSFYRLIPKEEHERLRKLIESSPAAVSVVADPIESMLVSKPDHEEIKRMIKSNPDGEVTKEIMELQSSIHDTNLLNLISKSKSIAEIVTERLNQETLEHYKKSKLINSRVRLGGTLGLGLTLEAASGAVSAGTIPFGLSSMLGLVIEKKFLEKPLDNLSHYLAKKWAFRDKGLPSVLWEVSQ
jgi:hypothetical protein